MCRESPPEDTHPGHPSLFFLSGHWRISPFLFPFPFPFPLPFLLPSLSFSCSLSFIFPKCNFQHWSQCMSSAMDPAHTSSCMWTCLTLPCATNARAINHGDVSISGCISLESMAEKSQASTSLKKHHDLSVLEREYGIFYYATDHADLQSVNQSYPVSTKFT